MNRIIQEKVLQTSLAKTAKTLSVPSQTLANYLAGCARSAGAEQIERRAYELGWDLNNENDQ